MKNLKKLSMISLTSCILATNTISLASGTNNAGDIQLNSLNSVMEHVNVDAGDIEVKKIDESEIPEGVTPMRFSNEKELNAFIKDIEDGKIIENELSSEIGPRSTRASDPSTYKQIGFARLYLKASYTASGGKVKTVRPYTQFTGYTYGYTWEESVKGAQIVAGGKAIKAYARGVVHWYILLDSGATRLTAKSVDIDMYRTIFR